MPMRTLPKEIIEKAFLTENGEFGWRICDIDEALKAIAETGQAILGGDVWAVEDGERVNLLADIKAFRAWDTGRRQPGEIWPDYCRRTCDESILQLEKIRLDSMADQNHQNNVFFSPVYVEENDVKNLIPQSKMDVERAKAAVGTGYPAVEPILPDLLEWIQDINWPVAEVLAPFLATIGSPLIPHIRNIFATDDHIWKSWIISYVMKDSREVAEAFRGDLERIAYSPTAGEAEEGLEEYAEDTLKQYGWEKKGL